MSTLTNCNVIITEIIHILKEESKAIKNGAFFELDRITKLKSDKLLEFDTAISNLESVVNIEFIAPQIEKLKRMTGDNAQLLKGAFHGVKAAQARLQSLSTHEAQLGAYDRTGESIILSDSNNKSEKHV